MKTSFLFFLTICTFTVLSQNLQNEAPKNNKCWKLTSYGIVLKPINYSTEPTEFADLKRIILKKNPLSTMPTSDYSLSIPEKSLFSFNIEVGISPEPLRELLAGIVYISGDSRYFEFSKSSNKRIDTIQVNNYTFFIDSFHYSGLYYAEKITELCFNIAYIYKTNQDRNFSFFVGYGVSAGYSTYSGITIATEKDSSEKLTLKNDQNNHNYSYYNNESLKSYSEKYIATDPSYFLRGYIPFGFNLRLSKKNFFWKHVNLQFISQFGLEYRNISGDIAFTRAYWSPGGIGLKFSL